MYGLRDVGAGEKAPPPNTLAYQNWIARAPGWGRCPAQQALDLRRAVAHWYVLRPYSRLGGLHDLAAGDVEGTAVVTGDFRCWIPTSTWRYLAGFGFTARPFTTGTMACLPAPPGLTALDVLPDPMGWPPVTVNRLPPFTRPATLAVTRALPSGSPGTPVTTPAAAAEEPRRLNPIAADPAAASAVLGRPLARLTLAEGVAWAVDDGRLFVWTHRYLRGAHRPRLAACAAKIRNLLAEPAPTSTGPQDEFPRIR